MGNFDLPTVLCFHIFCLLFFTTLASVTPTLISLKQTLKRCLRDDCTFMLCKKQCLNREQASIVTVSTGGGGKGQNCTQLICLAEPGQLAIPCTCTDWPMDRCTSPNYLHPVGSYRKLEFLHLLCFRRQKIYNHKKQVSLVSISWGIVYIQTTLKAYHC